MLLIGDCVEQMKTLEANSVDAIVTDPPYGLEFMGKAWDGFGTPLGFQTWSEQWAREAFRVLKPGGHLLAFGGTRMYHRLAAGIEDAGFEIRDTLMWLYGSGFPKSLDVSKAIDKVNGQTGRLFKFTGWMRTTGLTARQINEATGTQMGNHYLTHPTQPAIPTPEIWATMRPLCADVPAWVDELVARIAAEREVIGLGSSAIANKSEGIRHTIGASKAVEFNITAPSTAAAKRWQGWGTALKPAVEPIVLARKPLIGTVAENVLTHGTGALNIDASRIGTDDKFGGGAKGSSGFAAGYKADGWVAGSSAGRWPANILLDEEAAALLDEQSGNLAVNKVAFYPYRENGGDGPSVGLSGTKNAPNGYGDTGGASRFFYVAKAGRAERNKGLDGLASVRRATGYGSIRQPKCNVCGTRAVNWEKTKSRIPSCGHDDWTYVEQTADGKHPGNPERNSHPTVKPVDLMRYLIRLVTPKGGTVLDPFMGSGTTAVAAIEEGVNWIGCEREPEYVAIIEARIAAAQPGMGLNLEEDTK